MGLEIRHFQKTLSFNIKDTEETNTKVFDLQGHVVAFLGAKHINLEEGSYYITLNEGEEYESTIQRNFGVTAEWWYDLDGEKRVWSMGVQEKHFYPKDSFIRKTVDGVSVRPNKVAFITGGFGPNFYAPIFGTTPAKIEIEFYYITESTVFTLPIETNIEDGKELILQTDKLTPVGAGKYELKLGSKGILEDAYLPYFIENDMYTARELDLIEQYNDTYSDSINKFFYDIERVNQTPFLNELVGAYDYIPKEVDFNFDLPINNRIESIEEAVTFELDPISDKIRNPDDLFNMRFSKDSTFELVSNINLSNYQIPEYFPEENKFERGSDIVANTEQGDFPPITNYYEEEAGTQFSLEGNGHTISNFKNHSQYSFNGVGLFGMNGAASGSYDCYIRNLNIENVDILGNDVIGSILSLSIPDTDDSGGVVI